MALLNATFPRDISLGSAIDDEFNTTLLPLESGSYATNREWSYPRMVADVAYGVRTLAKLHALRKFFLAAGAMEHDFRFEDPLDYSSVDSHDMALAPAWDNQTLTGQVGTGSPQVFQLFKFYSTDAGDTQALPVLLPRTGLLFGWGGVQKTETVDYTVNYSTGQVTATVTAGQTPKWGGYYDKRCKFGTDRLSRVLSHYKAGSVQVPVMENRIIA